MQPAGHEQAKSHDHTDARFAAESQSFLWACLFAEDEWQIEADYPGAELRHIKSFKSKPEIDE
jgi:hypothetical protein